jgi:hypothetical protein
MKTAVITGAGSGVVFPFAVGVNERIQLSESVFWNYHEPKFGLPVVHVRLARIVL